jgi:hypothetical protein
MITLFPYEKEAFPKIIFCAIPEIIMLMIPNAGNNNRKIWKI